MYTSLSATRVTIIVPQEATPLRGNVWDFIPSGNSRTQDFHLPTELGTTCNLIFVLDCSTGKSPSKFSAETTELLKNPACVWCYFVIKENNNGPDIFTRSTTRTKNWVMRQAAGQAIRITTTRSRYILSITNSFLWITVSSFLKIYYLLVTWWWPGDRGRNMLSPCHLK